MASTPVSKTEIDACQSIVQNFKVNELHLLLATFRYPKLGKKQELVQRALSLLQNQRYQLSASQKIREIHASTRVRAAPTPYGTAPAVNANAGLANGNGAMQYPQTGAYRQMGTTGYGGHAPAANPYGAYAGGYGATSGYGYAQVPAVSGQAKFLCRTDLPFYDEISEVLPMTELPAYANQMRPEQAKVQYQFVSPQNLFQQLCYKDPNAPLPRHELQLRIFQLDLTSEQADAFPPNCSVFVDGYAVNLPAIIPTNKPNAEQKRLSRPVNITPYCQPPRYDMSRPHQIRIEWNGDKRAWAFDIWVVFRVNSQILQQRLLDNENAKRPFSHTKSVIIKRLGTDDDDGIQMDKLKASLLCPLMKTRMKIPARGVECTHLQCFDLTNFLMMNEKRPVWKCGVCDNDAHFSKLIVDEYFERVLREIGTSVDEVELQKDGSFRAVQEQYDELLSDDDGCAVVASGSSVASDSKPVVPAVPTTTTAAAAPAVAPKTKPMEEEEVITLDSDSEDEAPSSVNTAPPAAAATPQAPNSIDSMQTGTPATADDGNASDHSVIYLDDDEDLTPAAPASVSSGYSNSSSHPAAALANGVGRHSSTDSSTPGPVQNGENRSSANSPATTYWNGQNGSVAAVNGTAPTLQTNGYHSSLLRPIINETSRKFVAQELAGFLGNIAVRNTQFMPNST